MAGKHRQRWTSAPHCQRHRIAVLATSNRAQAVVRERLLLAGCLSTPTTAFGMHNVKSLGSAVGQVPSESSDRYGSWAASCRLDRFAAKLPLELPAAQLTLGPWPRSRHGNAPLQVAGGRHAIGRQHLLDINRAEYDTLERIVPRQAAAERGLWAVTA